jgi:hypothetical protein
VPTESVKDIPSMLFKEIDAVLEKGFLPSFFAFFFLIFCFLQGLT